MWFRPVYLYTIFVLERQCLVLFSPFDLVHEWRILTNTYDFASLTCTYGKSCEFDKYDDSNVCEQYSNLWLIFLRAESSISDPIILYIGSKILSRYISKYLRVTHFIRLGVYLRYLITSFRHTSQFKQTSSKWLNFKRIKINMSLKVYY